jgi:hypothetical protein
LGCRFISPHALTELGPSNQKPTPSLEALAAQRLSERGMARGLPGEDYRWLGNLSHLEKFACR